MTDKQLFAVLIHLRPLENGQINQYAGYQAYSAFLNLLRQVDPKLSQTLHDSTQRKPFTISPLMELESLNPNTKVITLWSHKTYQLRLTCLDGHIFNTFIQYFLDWNTANLTIRLGSTEFKVLRIEGNSGGEWVGQSSFCRLLESPLINNWSFQFSTPTVFSLGEHDWGGQKFVLLPDAGCLFDSLANCWNKFAPPQIAKIEVETLHKYVDKYVVVTRHSLQSAALQLLKHHQVGFVGNISYRLMDRNPPTAFQLTLSSLAKFAFYSGIGYKTGMGMGQTRLL
jgi:CRISPR-associated endoribonuclease Cas6